MCGIFCCLRHECEDVASKQKLLCSENITQQLSNRGPNCRSTVTRDLYGWKAHFQAHVLWMQGSIPKQQPVTDDSNNLLLWNGDEFNRDDYHAGMQKSDTEILFERLGRCSDAETTLKVLSDIEGPWSFIFWDESQRELWFGRDAMGRHSLLWSHSTDELIISSTLTRKDNPLCREVPAVGIFKVHISENELQFTLYPWDKTCMQQASSVYDTKDFPLNLEISTTLIRSPYPTSSLETPKEDDDFLLALHNLITMADLTPEVLFEALLKHADVEERVQKLLDVLTNSVNVRCQTQPQLCQDCVCSVLSTKSTENSKCVHSKVAVLFSGGLDSAVLALLADSCIPSDEPIDLINVAFTNEHRLANTPTHRKQRRRKHSESDENRGIPNDKTDFPRTDLNFEVPDRITGKTTYQEFLLLKPHRRWNFVEVNVSKEELVEQRQLCIADLIHPRCSILDDSLGCALWFAAQGKGRLHQVNKPPESYSSPARVLLLGMGADELLGGYARCRKLLTRSQDWLQLAQSLNHDLTALPTRNLGRDDRVVCDSGRQGRFPYLSEKVVNFIAQLPAHHRTAPLAKIPPGIGEKILLRLAAYKLGLLSAAQAPKRALQFGSRVAGLEARNEKGDSVCSRLILPLSNT